MVSMLDLKRVVQPGLSPGSAHCFVFLGKTQCLSPHSCTNGYLGI